MNDRLRFNSMVFYGYHGAFDAEKEMGGRIEVDLELYTDLAPSGTTDDVEIAINHVDVYTIVKDIVEEHEFNLLETLAERIAGQILQAYEVDKVRVRVRRPIATVGGLLDSIEVDILRGKDIG